MTGSRAASSTGGPLGLECSLDEVLGGADLLPFNSERHPPTESPAIAPSVHSLNRWSSPRRRVSATCSSAPERLHPGEDSRAGFDLDTIQPSRGFLIAPRTPPACRTSRSDGHEVDSVCVGSHAVIQLPNSAFTTPTTEILAQTLTRMPSGRTVRVSVENRLALHQHSERFPTRTSNNCAVNSTCPIPLPIFDKNRHKIWL